MRLHTLKIKDKYYEEVEKGSKPFELRKNDRDYKVDDLINFDVINAHGDIKHTDGVYQITYILKDVPEYGLDKDYCILGIRKLGQLFKWYKDK